MFKRLLPLAFVASSAIAAEGMWMPSQLPQMATTLEKAGLQVPPAQLADLTKAPMNAVISLGGCTASFVSPDGLVVTNHHCAYGAIQYNTTKKRNLIRDGFLAHKRSEELPGAPGSRIFVTESMTDVTAKMTAGLDQLHGQKRFNALEDKEKALVADCEQDANYRCSVFSYYGGAQYWLLKQLEIKDVRLVYAPAESVGVFGGDIDNWMWPRHTGDFSFYRAYVGKDGKPAQYSKDNVPFHPKHYLTINGSGVNDGDFVMVAGYPGSTNRYRTADEVKFAINDYYPAMQQRLAQLNDVIGAACKGDDDACIKYASYRQGLKNYAKNFQGQLEGFAKSDLVARKTALQQQLQQWVTANPEREHRYGKALDDLDALVKTSQARELRSMKLNQLWNSQLFTTAYRLYKWSKQQQLPDAKRDPGYQNRDRERLVAGLQRLDRRFSPKVDKALWLYGLKHYAQLPAAERYQAVDKALDVSGGMAAIKSAAGRFYAHTTLTDSKTRLAWLNKKPQAFKDSKDPFIKLVVASFAAIQADKDQDDAMKGRFLAARPAYMEALIAYKKTLGELVYPDANSSLRVTYGHIKGYTPAKGTITHAQDGAIYNPDGVSRYLPFTTLQGITAKNTGKVPFNAPKAELKLIAEKDYGPYYMKAVNSVPVNFLSTVDTTGGNSGSPTLNAKGQLVGLLFDGTYDSINADWDFTDSTRSIHVDTRYMLWVMSKLDGADNLIKEMHIVDLPAKQ